VANMREQGQEELVAALGHRGPLFSFLLLYYSHA